jgi:osmotically-inducible protein OsmY
MIRVLSLFLVSVLFLPSCTGLLVGAGATAGIAAAQEGGLSSAASDARIQLAINELWFSYDVETFRKLDLTINQGRVLITGVVQDPEDRVEAVRLAWQPRGVQQVINEIQVSESEGILGFAKDTWISTRLRTALTFDRQVLSINYNIDTVQGTVYLMGFAQNREELNRVIETARTISGVNGVVSYVKFVGGDGDVQGAGGAGGSSYQSTYSDEFVYRDGEGRSVPVRPYEDPNTPIDLRAPQARDDMGGAGTYPNNVDPVVTRGAPLEPVQREGIESEQILWDGQ